VRDTGVGLADGAAAAPGTAPARHSAWQQVRERLATLYGTAGHS
jgi:hypothetical protein